jgi:hypothetical protein
VCGDERSSARAQVDVCRTYPRKTSSPTRGRFPRGRS